MRYVFSTILSVLLILQLSASPTDVIRDMDFFTSIGSRADGTEGEKKALDYIAGRLEELNISYRRQSLNIEKQGHSFSENIIAEIPGSTAGRYIIAVPIDKGAFSTALILEIAEEFSMKPPMNTVVLTFLGAEHGETRFHPYGSRIAAEFLKQEKNIFALYLDSETIPRFWDIRTGGNGKVAPYWFTKEVSALLSREYIPFSLRGTDIQAARLGLQGDIGSLQKWLDSDIPTILFKGSDKAEGNEEYRQINHLIKLLVNLDFKLEYIPTTRENIYVFIRPFSGFTPRLIPELPYVSAFLIIAAIIMLIILLRFRDVRLNLKRFSSHWWAWPLLFVIVFLFFFLSTLIVEETLLLADFPDIWTYAPGTFVFFKIAVAAALSLNFILITRGLSLPRNPHFYSYAAIITSAIASLVFSAMDITLAVYSLWTTLNMLLFTATRKIRRKGFFLLLSTIPSLMGLIVIVKEPYLNIIGSLLLSRISGSLVLTLLIFPMILAITSLSYWKLHYDRTRYSVLTPAATLTLSLSSVITLFWILNLNPFSPEQPQKLILTDSIDLIHGDRRLEIQSPGPIGSVTLHLDGTDYPLENLGRKAEVRLPFTREPLEIETDSRSFLGRRTITGIISGESDPERIIIRITSSTPFTLHEANFPFEMSASGTSAEIFIGDNPPFPLTLKFTVNNDAHLNLTVVGNWVNPEDPPTINRPDIRDEAYRTARLSISL